MGSQRSKLLVVLAAFVAIILGAAVLLLGGDDDDDTAGTTTTVEESSTTTQTTAGTTTTVATTTTAVEIDTSTAVWPAGGSGTTYQDPVDAARGFAVDFVGFTDPVFGEFQQGDSRSGEVEVRPVADGPVTTVFVRQLSGSDDWWVLGSATAEIQVDEPTTGALITSPVELAGTSTAFEANVGVELRQDGATDALATGFVMGGSMGEMGPFEGELAFPAPTARFGALVFLTHSMADGQVWQASVVRVQLQP